MTNGPIVETFEESIAGRLQKSNKTLKYPPISPLPLFILF
jgi:hypothetical protein